MNLTIQTLGYKDMLRSEKILMWKNFEGLLQDMPEIPPDAIRGKIWGNPFRWKGRKKYNTFHWLRDVKFSDGSILKDVIHCVVQDPVTMKWATGVPFHTADIIKEK